MGDSTVTVNDALRLYDQWTLDPRVELVPEPRRVDKLFRRALVPVAAQSATKAIADCYLIGFAAEGGAHLVTLDKGLAGLARRQEVPVSLIRPV
jgi:predicted nucleic acid-binding protein